MSELSAKRPLTVIVCMVLVVTLGVISFTKMPSTLLPEFELPYVVAYASYPGANPGKVELAVTAPIEAALATAGGLEKMTSVSSEGLSLVIMQFAYSTNMDSALIEMNASLDLIKGYLDESVSSPTLMQIDPDMLPVIVAAVGVEGMDSVGASDYVSATVIPAIEKVDGVATVDAMGLVEDTIRIEFDDVKLDALEAKLVASVEESFIEPRRELSDALAELEDGEASLDDGAKEIEDGRAKLKRELRKQQQELDSARAGLDAARAEIEAGIGFIDAGLAPESGRAEAEAALAALLEQEAQLDAGEEALKKARRQGEEGLDEAEEQLNEGREELASAREELEKASEELEKAYLEALDAVRVRKLLSSDMMKALIAANNLSMPAGYAGEDGVKYSVKVGGPFETLEAIEELRLFESEEETVGVVRVKDVATVVEANNASASYAKINGDDGILLTVQKQSSASTTEVSAGVRAALEKLEAAGGGVHATVLSDQGVYIDIVVDSVLENLLMGAALAIIVLLLFLRSARPTFIVALSIPASLLLAVTLMYFTGVTLNLISLCGLAMGVGMLVDNSIVVIENIYRLRAEGTGTVKAAVLGAKEMVGPITASTLTTVCVFLPIVFTDGLSKELFADMGLTIAFSLLASLIIAVTLVPAMGSLMLEKGAKGETALFKKVMSGYERSLRFVLSHKALALTAAVALFGLSIYAALSAGTAFLPGSDSLQLIASAAPLDEDATQEEARALMDSAAERINAVPGVDDVGVIEGGGGLSSMASFGGDYSLYVLLDEGNCASSAEIGELIEESVADLPVSVSVISGSMDLSAMIESGISIDLYGDDLDVLRTHARAIAAVVAEVEGIATVSDGVGDTLPELEVSVDKEAAMAHGLTVAEVYAAVSDALSTETTAASATVSGREKDIIVVKGEAERLLPGDIVELELEGRDAAGEKLKLRLGDIATVTPGESQQSIARENGTRTLSITASLASGYNIGNVSRAVEDALGAYALPGGYTMEYSGENVTINDALSDLTYMGLLALLLIYLIMVAQFQSLLSPLIVMFTIPLAFTGGLLLQWACGFEVSVISMLGLLVLFGVVVNNGIVFVDCANGLYAAGGDRREALIAAGRRRMRPILMTALTTILALITMCLGLGTGTDIIQPMAVVLVGGLTYGTLLTLYIIPCMYELFRRKPPRVVII